MVEKLLLSLILTWILEIGYAWIWGVEGRDYWTILWMNLLTNPLVVLWYYAHRNQGFLVHTIIPEFAAVIAEILILKRFAHNIRNPGSLGFCINVFSYFCGLLFMLLFF